MYISLDIGGTYARIASFTSLDGVIVDQEKIELSHDADVDLSKINNAIEKFAQEEKIAGIGIGLPGSIDQAMGLMDASNNLEEWVNVEIVEIFSEKYDCEVKIENDAIMASLGEKYYGTKPTGSFVYLIWGTGVGCSHVQVAEGEVTASKIDRPMYLWDFESECGGANLSGRFNKDIEDITDSEWDEVFSDAGRHIMKISEGLQESYFVISGGVAQNQEERVRGLSVELKKNDIHLKMSRLGDDAGLYGGLAIF